MLVVVGHITIDAKNIEHVKNKLNFLKYPFRKNTPVPAGADAGTMNTNTNDDMTSDKIITQYFLRDPDGYYFEVCNCDEILTPYCLGEREDLPGYDEVVKPLSLKTASATINLMHRWMSIMEKKGNQMKRTSTAVEGADGSIRHVAALLHCKRADEADQAMLQTLKDHYSFYGDVRQNEEEEDIEEILIEAASNSFYFTVTYFQISSRVLPSA